MQVGMKITALDNFFRDLDRCGVQPQHASKISEVLRLVRRKFIVDHITYHAELPNYHGQGGFLFVLRNESLEKLAIMQVPYDVSSRNFVLDKYSDKVYFRKDLTFPERMGKSLEDLQNDYPLLSVL